MNEDKKIGRRTVARLVATQTLFQYHFHKKDISIETILNDTIELYIKEECGKDCNCTKMVDIDLARTLINGVEENFEVLDEIIEKNLKKGNKLKDIQGTITEILRLAVFELQNMKETPTKIIINEYVNLTSYFGEDSHITLANGILDNIAKQIR